MTPLRSFYRVVSPEYLIVEPERATASLAKTGYGYVIDSGEVSRGEKMDLRGTDPESYITEYTLVYEEYLIVEPAADVVQPPYSGTSLMKNNEPLGPHGRTMPRALWWS